MKKYKLIEVLFIFYTWLTKKDKKKIIKLFIFSLGVAFLELLCLITIQPLISLINNDSEISLLKFANLDSSNIILFLGSIFIFLLLITAILKVKVISYSHFISSDIGQSIGKKVLSNFLSQNYKSHKTRTISEVLNTFTHHLTRSVSFLIYFLEFCVSFFSCFFITSFIIYKNPIISIGTFICVVIGYYSIAKIYKSKILRDGQIQKESLDKVTNIINEVTRNIENTIINYKDNLIINDFHKFDKAQRNSIARMRNYIVLPRFIIEGIGISAFSCFAVLYAFFNNSAETNSSILIGTLGTLVFGMQKLLPSINTIYQSWSSINSTIPSVFSVKKLLSNNLEKNRIELSLQKDINHFNYFVELRNIKQTYDTNKIIFNKFNLKIKKGEKILIKGNSGSGKSTLVEILMSLIKPDFGDIIIDNYLLGEKISLSDWRRQIGYVKQKPFLKSGRIIDLLNGRYISKGEEIKATEKAKKLAKTVQIDKFIQTLPNKYFEYIFEDGSSLSGGQLQRIAIGNSLTLNPSLLIMDESTTGLEKEIELKIFQNLINMKDLTLIVISHSNNVDKIFSNKIDLNKENNLTE